MSQISWDADRCVIYVANYKEPARSPQPIGLEIGSAKRPASEPGHWVWSGPDAEANVLKWLEINPKAEVEKIVFIEGEFVSMETLHRVVIARLEPVQ